MFEAEKAREAEAKQEQMEQARGGGGGGGGRQMNSMNSQSPPASSGISQSETVRYINESDDRETTANGDEETLSVI